MATMGKLDAICARLKSTQKQLSSPSYSDDSGRLQSAEKEDARDAHQERERSSKVKNRNHGTEENNSAIDADTKSNLQFVITTKQASEDGQRCAAEDFEKVKVQNSNIGVFSDNNKTIDDSIINKHNSTSNNNIADATDYNNEIDSSFRCTTFQTADSTSVNGDPLVTSTTAEPNLCNEGTTAIKECPVSAPHSKPASPLLSDTTLSQEPCSQSSALSTTKLISPLDSAGKRLLPSSQDKPIKKCNHNLLTAVVSGIKHTDGHTFHPASSSVTWTQATPSYIPSNGFPSPQIKDDDDASNDDQISTSSSASLFSSNPSIFVESSKPSFQFPCNEKKRKINSLLHINFPSIKKACSSNDNNISDIASATLLNKHKKDTPVKSHSSQDLIQSSSLSSGRRKSRKPAKPQKQIASTVFTDIPTERNSHFGNPSSANSTEINNCFDSTTDVHELSTKIVKPQVESACDSKDSIFSENVAVLTRNHSPPLDLSFGNSSSNSNDQEFANASTTKIITPDSAISSAKCNDTENTIIKPKIKDTKIADGHSAAQDKINSDTDVSNSRLLSCRSPVVEATDSKVLVDFANNTMKELLGIYGFDGHDSKNVRLNNLTPFHSEKMKRFQAGADNKSSIMHSVKKEDEGESLQSKKPKNKFTKSGTFRRIIYTSLHAAKPNVTSKTSNDQLSSGEVSQTKGPAKTIKYAFSKKSYTQKVLNSADFTKCIRRYGTGIDCGGKTCQQLGYRDHYHCVECPHKAFIRKEETVRHYKWHKKRNDSLQHGFMRYSPLDDCSKKHGNCTHNGRQTHYHCVQGDCDKVYVSTSDVQMHANFHRKDSAIIQEGFQRFRATEDCGTTSCSFYGQRTTHFHCRRSQCHFTFKNKADMEKHKSYHQKDEVLSRDGFKKFMKYEACPYSGCRYSKINNHIHCIRPGCLYVLHSTAQLYSHKRKHERRELDNAYRSFKHVQQRQISTANFGNGVKSNGVKSHTEGQVSVGHTKILPLLASTIKSKPAPSLQSSTGNKVQTLQIQSPSSLNIVCNTTKKISSDINFALAQSLTSPKKISNFKITQDQIGEALNLSAKAGESMKVKEEPRQMLMLPVKLLAEKSTFSEADLKTQPLFEFGCGKFIKPELNADADYHQVGGFKVEVKSEIDNNGNFSILDCCDEPEDLSMPKKEKNNVSLIDSSCKTEISVKSESYSDSLLHISETCDDEDDDDIEDYDDDDDDDDDKDYGQVEEPTLVNTFNIGFENDNLNDSLNLFLPKQDNISRGASVKKETDLDVSEVKPATTNVGKVLSAAQSSCEKVTSLHADTYEHSSPTPHQSQQSAPQAILTSSGKVLGVHIPLRLMPERRERDESWKRYLIRYTANDACFSRCSCLYKDHYHCRIEGCQVIFKSKDGVRGHARFHELQDSITPLVYLHYEPSKPCEVAECPYSGKEEHFHCNWTDCSHIIPASAPTFYRLEHYRIHEYATASMNKTRNSFLPTGCKIELDPLQKRRGRPPKYPKYDLPIVPKVHLTEKEILDSTLAFIHNKSSKESKIINGFKKFIAPELCPDDLCTYKGKDHFHCGRKYCHMSTDRLDVLNLHAKDFHNNVTILVGYEFFERMVNCRRLVCQNNKINRHFHCMRPRCDYSFVRHSTMLQHNKKHPTVTSAVLSTPVSKSITSQTKTATSQFVPIAPAVTQATATQPTSSATKITASPSCNKTVKSSGTYFPLSAVSNFKLSSLTSSSKTSSKILPSAGTSHVLPSTPITQGTIAPTQIISGAQVFHTQDGAGIFSTGTILTLPHNLITTTIPFLSANGQQTSVLTGLIPVGQLSQHGLTAPLVSIANGQLIAAPQGHVLQPGGGILGAGVVQVIRSPATITTNATSTPATISTLSGSSVAPPASIAPPVTFLLQPHPQQDNTMTVPLNWASLKKRMRYTVNLSCGRPFCKLKKKDHYHCLDCNQAFSDPARLRAHISKHGFKFKTSEKGEKQHKGSETKYKNASVLESISPKKNKAMNLSFEATEKVDNAVNRTGLTSELLSNEELSSSLNLQPSIFSTIVQQSEPPVKKSTSFINGNINNATINNDTSVSLMHHQQELSSETEDLDIEEHSMSQLSNSSDSKYGKSIDSPTPVTDDGFNDSNESSLDASSSSLTLCLSLSRKSGRKRSTSIKDTLVIPQSAKQRKILWKVKSETDQPDGYKRVRCGEDCGHIRCAYRQTVTHFHCLRADCGYGFSDKSRIIQHRMRHERLDALMGGEFQQYRASVTCDRADCEFNEKASHFHCLKCPYSCADSSKVPAHRKYHTKLDNINSNGFIKFAGTADCKVAACSYFRKQTHYHCTFPGCIHAVLGPSQMAPHKLKHAQHQSV